MRTGKVIFLLSIIPFIVAGSAGCQGARELNALSLVLGIGVDKKASEPQNVSLTAQIVRPEALKKSGSKDNSGGSQSKSFWNLESSGKTMFDAIREYTHQTHNKLYIAHNDIILFGKDAAADGVFKYLDFFERAPESRPTTVIAVSATTASEALETVPELDKLPAVNITKLIKSQEFTSQSREVTLQEFTNNLLSKTKSPVAPLVWVTEQNSGEKMITVKGMAVFKGDRMVGELDENESRGLLWVEGKVKSGVIDIEYGAGQVTIEIMRETTKMKPQISDGKITIQVEIKEEGIMTAQTCSENLESPYHMTILESIQQETIRQEILNTFEKAKQLHSDIFGFGELLHKSNPSEWKKMEDCWDQVFPLVQVDVKAECKIRAAGNITRPSLPE